MHEAKNKYSVSKLERNFKHDAEAYFSEITTFGALPPSFDLFGANDEFC